MTKIEKIIIAVILVLCSVMFSMCGYSVMKVKQAGGIDQVIIDAGKQIKHIKKEINN